MKKQIRSLAITTCVLGLTLTAFAKDPATTKGENYATEFGAPVSDSHDLVFERFDVVKGVDHGNPYLRVQGTINQLFAGQAGPATLVIERVLTNGDNVYYLVRPRPGAAKPGGGPGIGNMQTTQASVQLLDAEWGKTYTFMVLNFTGGTSARHAGVSTFVVPLTQPR